MVVFPEPVGPVAMKMPFGRSIEQKIVDVIGHSERFELEVDDAPIEHPQDQALTELGWQC